MWPFPKAEFEWKEPREFRDAIDDYIVRHYGLHWKRKASIFLGLFFVYFHSSFFFVRWIFPDSQFRQTPFGDSIFVLPYTFLFGVFMGHFFIWLQKVPNAPYRLFENYIDLTDKRTKIRYDRIRDCNAWDFGSFVAIEIVMKNERKYLIGGPATPDLNRLSDLLNSHGVTIRMPDQVFRWPEEAAIEKLDRIRTVFALTRRGETSGQSRVALSMSVRDLIILVLIIGTMLGISLRLKDRSELIYRQYLQADGRFDELASETGTAKAAAGKDWPSIRDPYIAKMRAQADLAETIGDRYLTSLIPASLYVWMTYFLTPFLVIFMILKPRGPNKNQDDP